MSIYTFDAFAVPGQVITAANWNAEFSKLESGLANANLVAQAGLSGGANSLPYYTGSTTMALTTLTPFARTLLDDTDAATMRGTLGAMPVEPTALGAAVDLNTIITPGFYGQAANAGATGGSNYPSIWAGTLLVQQAGSGITTQQYTEHLTGKIYTRARYLTSWGAWREALGVVAGAATISGNASDGSDGLTLSSYKPVLTMWDRSTGAHSFRWAADNGSLRLDVDNANDGATWRGDQLVIDPQGRVATGGGWVSSQVGLYVRPTELTSTTAYGVYARPEFNPAVQTVGRVVYAQCADLTGSLPRVDNFVGGCPSVTGGTLGEVNQFVAFGTSQTTVAEAYGFRGAVSALTGKQRWNLFCDGTAPNYLASRLLIGSTVDSGDALQVTGNARVTGSLSATLVHEAGYQVMRPYSATYDNGRLMRMYFAGYGSDGTTHVNEIRITTDSGACSINLMHGSAEYRINNQQVVGARETGWTAAGGTVAANKGSWSPNTLGAASATYVQAELTATRTALNAAEARIKALEAALRNHGLIN